MIYHMYDNESEDIILIIKLFLQDLYIQQVYASITPTLRTQSHDIQGARSLKEVNYFFIHSTFTAFCVYEQDQNIIYYKIVSVGQLYHNSSTLYAYFSLLLEILLIVSEFEFKQQPTVSLSIFNIKYTFQNCIIVKKSFIF